MVYGNRLWPLIWRTISTRSSRIIGSPPDDFDQIVAHHRLAARYLHHARPQRLHAAPVFVRPQIGAVVLWTAMIAVAAVTGAGVGDLERDHDGALRDPVQ